jgi:Cupin superfamily protein
MSTAPLFTGRFVELAGADFASARLGQDFVRAEAGADRVGDLLTWSALNGILSTHQLVAPQLRLFRDGAQVPVARYTRSDGSDNSADGRQVLLPDALYRELRAGASLVLDSIDQLHPPITAAADDLMRLVRELVQVNLYLVWGDHQGFDTHWDDHDTVIVQLAGSKHWTVHGPGRRYPMKVDTGHDHGPPESVVWQGNLAPGDIIHVPRGWWHAVRGTGEMSMHLTFGFTRRTGIDWARWVVEQLYSEELFRQDLPRFGGAEQRREHEDELVRTLAKVITAHRPADFLATRDRRFPRRPEINLPFPVRFEMPPDEAGIEVTALLELTVESAEPSDAGAVSVTVSGKTFRFAAVMAPMLRLLAQERVVTVARLRAGAGELDPDRFAAALELLLQQHLVVLRD